LIFEQKAGKMVKDQVSGTVPMCQGQEDGQIQVRLTLHVEEKQRMAKRRGNPNWGKPEPIGPVVPTVTSFEQVVKEFKLTPDQYVRSTRLREWARRNKNSKYIPEALLEAWGFEIESTL
jgi:predicted metal-binding protein